MLKNNFFKLTDEIVPSCFFAYPSEPIGLTDAIEEGISRLNNGKSVIIDSWKDTKVGGKFIITEICKAIDSHNLFACDTTSLNPNVLFELGYAIGNNKRIWVTRDPSVDESDKNYARLDLLTTIGYAPYTNSIKLVEAFYRDKPYEDLNNTIYNTVIKKIIKNTNNSKLVYLKSKYDSEASIKLANILNTSQIPLMIDDPNEIQSQTLEWYIQNIYFSYGIIVHLIGSHRQGWQLHNAKYSLFSGLAYGFGKPLIMLAEEPFNSPIDYKDLIKVYSKSSQAKEYISSWISELENNYKDKIKKHKEYESEIRNRSELRNIYIGDPVAENESEELLEYFVDTSAYTEALNNQQSIFVGRKGSGKTANLFKIANQLEKNDKNFVCIIKPVAYELEGVIEMLQLSLPKAEHGFLIESFWKFLIYTELAKSISDKLKGKPPYYQLSCEEENLIDYINTYSDLLDTDFSIRLEYAVKSLCNLDVNIHSNAEQRLKISEILHIKIIGKLVNLIRDVFNKKDSVVILVDNLDKTWKKRYDLPVLSQLLFGLLRITNVIKNDFQKTIYIKKKINLNLIIFLRSDIFKFILDEAREPDKINYSFLNWDNPELLLRVIEERFLSLNDELTTPDSIWDKYFCKTIGQTDVKKYLLERIIPRPRDIIYICRACIDEAVNNGHIKVEENDVLKGEYRYSQYVLDSLLVENGISIQSLEKILYEFAGSSEILLSNQVSSILSKVGIEKNDFENVLKILIDLTFLGLEINNNQFVFLYNESEKPKYSVLARKFVEENNKNEYRYAINKAFHSYLEIKS